MFLLDPTLKDYLHDPVLQAGVKHNDLELILWKRKRSEVPKRIEKY